MKAAHLEAPHLRPLDSFGGVRHSTSDPDRSSSWSSDGVSTWGHPSTEPDSPTLTLKDIPPGSASHAEESATQFWGIFIGEDWRQDPKTAGTCSPTIRVPLPANVDGLRLMQILYGRYPVFKKCLVETVDGSTWAVLGCIPGLELHQPQWKKVMRMRPLSSKGRRLQIPRYAIVYVASGRKGPGVLPAAPDLIISLPNTLHASTVLSQLQKAKPHHRFKLLKGPAHSEDAEWQQMDIMLEVPPGSLHVWASPMGEQSEEEEEVIILPAKESSSAVAEKHRLLLRRRHAQS